MVGGLGTGAPCPPKSGPDKSHILYVAAPTPNAFTNYEEI